MNKIVQDKFRTHWDFLSYVCKKNILGSIQYYLGLFLTIIGLFLTPFILNIGFIVSMTGAALAIVGYFRDWYYFKKYEKYKLVTKNGFSIANINKCESDVLDDQEEIGEYSHIVGILNEQENNTDYYFMSHKLNKYLWESSHHLTLELNNVKSDQLAELIKENWKDLSHYLMHNTAMAFRDGKAFYNEKKLCMGDGFRLSDDKSTLIVNCSKGSYYDTFLTNNIFEKYLLGTHSDMERKYASLAFREMKPYFNMFDLGKIAFEEANTLRSFKNLLLNNEFGLSTIAITKDHYVFQMIQSERAMESGCLIAPSGSGSCDYEDIHNHDFRKTITYAMQRELWEETGFKCPRHKKRKSVEAFGETYLVGFFRWLKRNGKPEFLGVTYINSDFSHLRPNTAEVKRKTVLTEKIVTINDFKAYLANVKSETKPKSTIGHIGVSVPLLACVTALEELLKDDNISKELAEKLHLGFC